MNKKVLVIVLAVLAFFAGQIFLEEALAAAGAPEKTLAEFLVPVFELVVGGILGYKFRKYKDEAIIENYENQYSEAKAETIHLTNELIKLKKSASKPSKKKDDKVS